MEIEIQKTEYQGMSFMELSASKLLEQFSTIKESHQKTCYFIGGTSGAGKSTLIKSVTTDTIDNLDILSTGDLFKSVTNNLFGILVDRDQMKYLNWKMFEPYVAASLGGAIKYSHGDLVIDSHYGMFHQNEFVPAMNEENLQYVAKTLKNADFKKVKAILVDADITLLHERIKNDNSRLRELSLDFLAREQEANMRFQDKYVSLFNQELPTESYIIKNHYLFKAKKEFRELFSSYLR